MGTASVVAGGRSGGAPEAGGRRGRLQGLEGGAGGAARLAAAGGAAAEESLLGRALVAALVAYKRWLSPLLPRSCRFTPTCSEYARLAVLRYGALRGGALALARLLRCHPFHPGGVDLP